MKNTLQLPFEDITTTKWKVAESNNNLTNTNEDLTKAMLI